MTDTTPGAPAGAPMDEIEIELEKIANRDGWSQEEYEAAQDYLRGYTVNLNAVPSALLDLDKTTTIQTIVNNSVLAD